MPRSRIGFLVPVDKNLEKDSSLPGLPLFYGPNFIGLNDISIPDQRLNSKHIALTNSPDGSADLLVEAANPVVVRSSELRKKLSSGENAVISNGEIIELLPGHVSSSAGETKRSFGEANSDGENEKLTAKRMRNQDSEDEATQLTT